MTTSIFDEVNKEARKRAIAELKQEFLVTEDFDALAILNKLVKGGEEKWTKKSLEISLIMKLDK